ncbi:MAG: hypothetical protein RMK64_00195 [Rhodovarius sp.]|nr:hypothetical protein [Rhodovarius sp.]MDW8313362.1 hypothetical protein [Rhodovarius sp.]
MTDQTEAFLAIRRAAAGISVRIMDLSGGNGAEPMEVVRGFGSLGHANTFARRYVRDSIERCRARGMSPDEVIAAWFAYGEDAVVDGAGPGVWRSGTELRDFAARPIAEGAEQRDWRALDPRRAPWAGGDEEEESDEAPAETAQAVAEPDAAAGSPEDGAGGGDGE